MGRLALPGSCGLRRACVAWHGSVCPAAAAQAQQAAGGTERCLPLSVLFSCHCCWGLPEQTSHEGDQDAQPLEVRVAEGGVGKAQAVFAALRAAKQARTDVAYGNLPVRICASHSGLSIGPGGPTHQSIEDIAIYRGMPNMTVVVPADGVEAAAVTRAIAEFSGPAYMRLSRAKERTVYMSEEGFTLGIARKVRDGGDDAVLACGPCVGQALEAAELLSVEGIEAQVIDVHTIKPMDAGAVVSAAQQTGVLLTAEEHSVIGGLGSAIAEVLAEAGLGVCFRRLGLPDQFPTTGPYEDLVALYGLDPGGLAKAVPALLSQTAASSVPPV